jgi:4-hydroxy-3-methylbut-2-en-1-yl diphosphate synthase IspG/GcpE
MSVPLPFERRESVGVSVGPVTIGGGAPIVVQSMT